MSTFIFMNSYFDTFFSLKGSKFCLFQLEQFKFCANLKHLRIKRKLLKLSAMPS